MNIQFAQCSMPGGRPYNEDCVRCAGSGSCFSAVVADGLGGHGGGEVASSTAAEVITSCFAASPSVNEQNIKGMFEEANRQILAAQTPSCKMKSTCVALFINGNDVSFGHIGDSRLYHFADGRLVFQTVDHSVSQMAVFAGEITPAQIRFHEDRNKVLRALGNDLDIKPEISMPLQLASGFHAFLLCTDGFWEYVLEEEMEIDLSKSHAPQEWISLMLQRLYKRVDGTNDNFSAIAVFTDISIQAERR